jgi:hypothetical protein
MPLLLAPVMGCQFSVRGIDQVKIFLYQKPTSLSAVTEAHTSEELGVETLCRGRLRYSALKEAAPGDYGICIWGAGLDHLRVCRCCQSAWAALVAQPRPVLGLGREP